jgi:hypothetical protein
VREQPGVRNAGARRDWCGRAGAASRHDRRNRGRGRVGTVAVPSESHYTTPLYLTSDDDVAQIAARSWRRSVRA